MEATIHIIKKGALTAEEIEHLRGSGEVLTEEEYEKRVDQKNKEDFVPFRKELEALSFSQKLEWYSKRNSQELVYLGNNPHFQRYWKWRVRAPLNFKRFYYRLKNGELWKKYEHITEMKKKVKPHSI